MFGRLGGALSPHLDENRSERARLRVGLEIFRERVGQLIVHIPRDMPGFTVHDLTHLDALWEMADVIAGPAYEINPAEAFVLGGAILLHDAGMTVAAYLGGKEELEKTPEFSAALASAKIQLSAERVSNDVRERRVREIATVDALRTLHPLKAENLATQEWKAAPDGASLFLIDDDGLRAHFGSLIGRIAHSHHWDHARLQREFQTLLGAPPSFPARWSVDPLKIALLLRCADAAHLDERRAPRMQFSISRISGVSKAHWTFQNKLAKPVVAEGKLQYTSTSDFGVDQSEAWQLAYDTLKMVDSELRAAAEINIQRRFQSFAVDGVLGVSSPGQLAKYIRVSGWKPVALNLQVSNVPHLARTLGGKDLYLFRLAPLRELLQNAADSVEARVAIDPDFSISDAKIAVSILDDGRGPVTIEVVDNGVGMSERVLTGPLLDFGFSFWKSAEARREFPGLHSNPIAPRGRFGIGFFSVFMWADEVEVASRVYSAAVDNALVLHFQGGLDSRPLLRASTADDRSTAWSTRVRLRLSRETADSVFKRNEDERLVHRREHGLMFGDWVASVKALVATLPVRVIVKTGDKEVEASNPDWLSYSAEKFVESFSVLLDLPSKYQKFASALTDLSDGSSVVGRGFLLPYEGVRESGRIVVCDRGIFAGFATPGAICGVVQGQVLNAARERFSAPAFVESQAWLREAATKAFAVCDNAGEEIAVQRTLVNFKFIYESRSFFIVDRAVVSLAELLERIGSAPNVWFRLEEERDDEFGMPATDSLSAIYGLSVDPERVHSLFKLHADFQEQETVHRFVERSDSLLAKVFAEVLDVFGSDCEESIVRIPRESYQKDLLDVRFSRG